MCEFVNNLVGKKPVKVITTNGFHMRGKIVEAGQNYIVLELDGKQSLVFTHAISTIENF